MMYDNLVFMRLVSHCHSSNCGTLFTKKKKTHLSNCIRHVGMVASQLFWKKIFFLLVSFLLQEDISLVALIDEKF